MLAESSAPASFGSMAEVAAQAAESFALFALWCGADQKQFLTLERPKFWIGGKSVTRFALPHSGKEQNSKGMALHFVVNVVFDVSGYLCENPEMTSILESDSRWQEPQHTDVTAFQKMTLKFKNPRKEMQK